MPTPNFDLPLINGASPISIVNDMNALATAADSAMSSLATQGDLASIRTVVNQAAKDATTASSKADAANATAGSASQTASTALSQSNTAIANAQSALTDANTANELASSAVQSVNKFVANRITRIDRTNATTNDVLRLTDASVIGENATDGICVIETEWYYFIEFRGITPPDKTTYVMLGTFMPTDTLQGVKWLNFAGLGWDSKNTEFAMRRETSETRLDFVVRTLSPNRSSGWVIIPRKSTVH